MADAASHATITMRNYHVTAVDSAVAKTLEAWFAAADRGDNVMCVQCTRWRQGCVRNTLELYTPEPCARCGSLDGTQLHHWAPRAIFTDADRWPMSYLCITCHRTWHQAMRAAGGVSLHTKASAA